MIDIRKNVPTKPIEKQSEIMNVIRQRGRSIRRLLIVKAIKAGLNISSVLFLPYSIGNTKLDVESRSVSRDVTICF